MKKIERLTKNIEKAIKEKRVTIPNEYYSIEQLISDSFSYISAIKQGRMIVSVVSVSQSGMTRRMIFKACVKDKKENRYFYRQYSSFFKALNHTVNKNLEIVVSGCGMDMIFHTNYCVIRTLTRLGFLSLKEGKVLEQKTPQYI